MHVAHFVQRYPPAIGGSEVYFARLTEYLRTHGDTVDVWTTNAIELPEFWSRTSSRTSPTDEPFIRRYRPLVFPLRRYVLKAFSLVPYPPWQAWTLPCNPFCPQMWRDVANYEGPLDAVHTTAFPYSFPIACGLRLARRRGVPFLLTPFLHLGDPTDPHDRTRRQYTQSALVYLLRQADHLFAQTHRERDAIVSLGVAAERVTVQGLGVEPSEVTGGDRERTRRDWGVRDEFVIGHLANASIEKGTVDLLRATAHHPVRVVLAGPSMPNFERFWATYPRQDRVTRLGAIAESQKRNFYAAIDAFALPSRTDSFGLVVLEAWANAKPVVVYAAGGPGELVRDGVDGVVVPCRVDALSDAIASRLLDRRTATRLGEAGRTRAEREFGWDDKLARVRNVIAKLVRT